MHYLSCNVVPVALLLIHLAFAYAEETCEKHTEGSVITCRWDSKSYFSRLINPQPAGISTCATLSIHQLLEKAFEIHKKEEVTLSAQQLLDCYKYCEETPTTTTPRDILLLPVNYKNILSQNAWKRARILKALKAGSVGVIYQSAKFHPETPWLLGDLSFVRELRNECEKEVEEREKGLFWTDDYINAYSGLKQQCAAQESGGSEMMIHLCFNFKQRPNTKGEIMTQLEYRPILTALSVTKGFRSWNWNLNKVYNREDDPTPVIGLHGVLFVGYRLNRNTGELDVLLMNSWLLEDGTKKLWGENGFGWIRVRNAAAAGIMRPMFVIYPKSVFGERLENDRKKRCPYVLPPIILLPVHFASSAKMDVLLSEAKRAIFAGVEKRTGDKT